MRFLREDAERPGDSFLGRGWGGLSRPRAFGLRWLRSVFRSKLGEGRLANDGAALHAAVVLSRRERMRAPDPGERDAAVEARCPGGSDGEGIEPHPGTDPSRAPTTVAKGEGHHAGR